MMMVHVYLPKSFLRDDVQFIKQHFVLYKLYWGKMNSWGGEINKEMNRYRVQPTIGPPIATNAIYKIFKKIIKKTLRILKYWLMSNPFNLLYNEPQGKLTGYIFRKILDEQRKIY